MNHVHHNSHPSVTRKEHRYTGYTAYTMLVPGYLHWQVGTQADSGSHEVRARLTHRGWSEFRNLKFQVDSEDVIPMWADKAQSSPLKDWSFCQAFVKLAKDHFKWYCDTRSQYVMWQFLLQNVERWLLNWPFRKITTGLVWKWHHVARALRPKISRCFGACICYKVLP